MVIIPLIYLILLATVLIVWRTRFHDPMLLYRLTREDGLVEWCTVVALVALALYLLVLLYRDDSTLNKRMKAAAASLSLLSLLAAGEEISWGQRIFGFKTGETMQQINLQRETNLHNLIPAPVFNGIIIFSVAIFLVVLPYYFRKRGKGGLWWLPSTELSILTLATVLVNHYRVSYLAEKAGLIFLVFLLTLVTFDSLKERSLRLLAACAVGWLTCGVLYSCRMVLAAANQQYEIRELLVILLVFRYCSEVNQRMRYGQNAKTPPGVGGEQGA